MDSTKVMTDPKKLVRIELKNAGFDLDTIEVPERVYLLADDIFDMMLTKNCGQFQYPVGGGIYIFNDNYHIGFAKANMCSPAIATQAEDLIACGVKELIHIGYAGGLSNNIAVGDIVLTDGAFNDTAVAGLYGYDFDFIESTKTLTDNMSYLLIENSVAFRRGKHWTTDAGYRETWEQIDNYRKKNALCVEMEGAGLFTIAKYRNCSAAAMYIISDTLNENGWSLGWGGNIIGNSVQNLLETIIPKKYNGDTMDLQYRKATIDEADRVCYIVQHTKAEIYPYYYTQAVVDFFGRLHSIDNIIKDIEQGRIGVLLRGGEVIGTGSHTDNHITRVYVLPEFQGQGYGSRIMDELEKEIFASYDYCELDASLPACIFYENRGFKTVKHVKYDIGDGAFMIYEIMRKEKDELHN